MTKSNNHFYYTFIKVISPTEALEEFHEIDKYENLTGTLGKIRAHNMQGNFIIQYIALIVNHTE